MLPLHLVKRGWALVAVIAIASSPLTLRAANDQPAAGTADIRPEVTALVNRLLNHLRVGQRAEASVVADQLAQEVRAHWGSESIPYGLARSLQLNLPGLGQHPEATQRDYLGGWWLTCRFTGVLDEPLEAWLDTTLDMAVFRQATAAVAGDRSFGCACLDLYDVQLSWKSTHAVAWGKLAWIETHYRESADMVGEYWTVVDVIAAQWLALRGDTSASSQRIERGLLRARQLASSLDTVADGDISDLEGYGWALLQSRVEVLCEYAEAAVYLEMLARRTQALWPENRWLAIAAWSRLAECMLRLSRFDDPLVREAVNESAMIAAIEPPLKRYVMAAASLKAHVHLAREEWASAAHEFSRVAEIASALGVMRSELDASAHQRWAEFEGGDPGAAGRLADVVGRARTELGETDSIYLRIACLSAHADARLGQFEQAAEVFDQVITHYESSEVTDVTDLATALWMRGLMRQKQGRLVSAREDWSAAMQLLRRKRTTRHYLYAKIESDWLDSFR